MMGLACILWGVGVTLDGQGIDGCEALRSGVDH